MDDYLIQEYYKLKEKLNLKDFGDVQNGNLNNLLDFIEQKVFKIEVDTPPVDTIGLSKILNKFLNDNGITKKLFNSEITGLTCTKFYREPLKWSSYKPETQKRIKAIEQFLNDDQKREEFLKKHARETMDDDDNEPNTFELSRRVGKLLKANGISNKIFNKEIAQTSYSSLYRFLKKPKEFSAYMKFKEIQNKIVEMNNFMNDEKRVKEFIKRHSSSSNDGCNLTRHQTDCLTEEFERDQYPAMEVIEHLSDELSLSVNTILNWFQSKRGDDDDDESDTSSISSTSDFEVEYVIDD